VREPGDEIPKRPTPEQDRRMRLWLEESVAAILHGKPSPVCGDFIGELMESDLDFTELYLAYGFEADGIRKDFNEVQKRWGAF
jgi:hypothetical protein